MNLSRIPLGRLCWWTTLLLLTVPQLVGSEKILFAFPFSATSHNIFFNSLSTELASRGHDVTYISPYPIKSPPKNHKQIVVKDILKSTARAHTPSSESGLYHTFKFLRDTSLKVCRTAYATPEIKELIKSGQFDMVVSSIFFSDCFHVLSHVFNASLVLMSPAGTFPNDDLMMGNPALPSFVPNIFSTYSDRMNLWERLTNTLTVYSFQLYNKIFIVPYHEEIIRDVFGESMPSVSDVQSKTSLLLLNSHFSFLYPHPAVPAVVEVGGMHVKQPKPLPEDIKKIMDEAEDGVIYFSMGSYLQSADFPEPLRKSFLEAFGELKQKVLWKWEKDSLPGQPPNVKLSKWWPQSDILAHPNTKLFITHGGLLSLEEAFIRGVPLIGIPVFGDQQLNMNRVAELGVGLKMSLSSLTKETILKAIRTVLEDPSFAENMKKRSAIAKDRPLPPLEKAVYWIEYVLRHDGAPHLRSAGVDLSWFQFFLVDIAMILMLALATLPVIFMLILRTIANFYVMKKKVKDKKQ
ncbi:UDP-glycosyltransferase [Ladona fulva]|uniref:UDP-glucuronosyltransferase n=1 Tax=Ladona fulva TaxID=123851 RepID=A0A8K0P0G7_LADFU|nr:UDP-glycosyltransferase [Ladona fulva]